MEMDLFGIFWYIFVSLNMAITFVFTKNFIIDPVLKMIVVKLRIFWLKKTLFDGKPQNHQIFNFSPKSSF